MSSDNNKNAPRFISRRDLLILAVVLALALVWFFAARSVPADVSTQAVITIDQVEVARIDLKAGEPEAFSFSERPAVHFQRCEDGSFAFVESDCPDKVCIRAGKLKMPYHYAACLPNLVVVTIETVGGAPTESMPEVDFVY